MSYDLFLQTDLESPAPEPEAGWEATLQDHSQFIAACEVTLFDSEPDDLSVDALEDGIDSGEHTLEDFHQFCALHGLPADPSDARSAAAFLESQDGRALAVIHLPQSESEARKVYSSLVSFATAHGLRLVDAQMGADIDLSNPGDLPPLWR